MAALLDPPDRKVRPVEAGPLTGRMAMVNSGSPACCDNPDKCCREPYAQAPGCEFIRFGRLRWSDLGACCNSLRKAL